MAPFTPPAADAMRAKLLLAARDEFSAVGIGGARIERIAAASASNKAQIFHYFGSKEGLFDALFAQTVAATLDEVPLDTDDLGDYAGRLHDHFVQHPWVPRLATWHRLERGKDSPLEAVVSSHGVTIAEVERAQRAGVLPRSFRAPVLLGLVVHLAAFWSDSSPEFETFVPAVTPARRRQIIVDAATALVGG
jgi:AcrR family transcriptional regulator